MLTESLFPPELVMQNQQAIGLKDDQSAAIRAELQKTMAQTTDLMWQQSAEEESLAAEMKKERIDEEKAMAHLDKLMGIENQIKRGRMEVMLKVKNTLTPEQQTKLRDLMKQQAPARQSQGMGMMMGQRERMGPQEMMRLMAPQGMPDAGMRERQGPLQGMQMREQQGGPQGMMMQMRRGGDAPGPPSPPQPPGRGLEDGPSRGPTPR
jgi:Spy/CpxP family protein refolding chaperone